MQGHFSVLEKLPLNSSRSLTIFKQTGMQSIEDGITNCSYVWSKTALYLLGPKALYWFTLSAICIDEVDVTIELPCLCNDVYNSLLSRLTYLVRTIIKYIVIVVDMIMAIATCSLILNS